MGYVLHGLYYIDNKSNNKQYPTNLNVMNIMLIHNASNLKYSWHLRLGHITNDRITKLKKLGLLSNLESSTNPTCEAYIQGKMTRSPFFGQMARAKEILEIIHSDVYGPFNQTAT